MTRKIINPDRTRLMKLPDEEFSCILRGLLRTRFSPQSLNSYLTKLLSRCHARNNTNILSALEPGVLSGWAGLSTLRMPAPARRRQPALVLLPRAGRRSARRWASLRATNLQERPPRDCPAG